jgi:hypothetical protein
MKKMKKMKKQGIFSVVALVAILMLASCNKYEAKTCKLNNQTDSLNYTLGLANGDGIKNYYLRTDSTIKPIATLMNALDKAYKGANKGEMYNLGLQIGNSLKQQKAKGLMGDSTLTFNEKLVKQGLVNSLNGFNKGMTVKEAQEYIQKTMMKIQQEKMSKQPIQNQPAAPQQAAQPAAQPAPQPAK